MSFEQSNYPESRLQKLVELRWQREVLERWLNCSETSAESQAQLQEMLTHIDAELVALEAPEAPGQMKPGGAHLKQAD